MGYNLVLILIGTFVLTVLPMGAITWYSLREDAHSPAPLREETSDSSS